MTKLTPTRTGSVDARPIVVLDELLPADEVAVLTAALENGRFKRTEYARPDTIDHKHWVIEPVSPELGAPSLGHVTQQVLEQFFGAGYEPFRIYCNVALYGDMLMTHTDCREQDDIITALWYVSTEWNVEWGGETVFFDKKDDALFCVSPKPGRLCVFHGAIKHVGRPPNRLCYTPRFTLALKFARPPASAGS
jgi:hypothetical protein